jgi:hypothetical protein
LRAASHTDDARASPSFGWGEGRRLSVAALSDGRRALRQALMG